MARSKITAKMKAEWQQMRDEGETLQYIADTHKVSKHTVFAHTTAAKKTPQTKRQKKHTRTTAEERKQMIDMRLTGHGVQEIADEFNVSLSVVSRWTDDAKIPKPRKTKPITDAHLTALERKDRRADQIADDEYQARQASMKALPTTDTFTLDTKSYPDTFEDRDYNTDGPLPDPSLIQHAEAILNNWTASIAKGRIYPRRPIPVTKASIILTSSIPVWDYEQFLQTRTMWRTIRDLSGVNSATLADRLDISHASISRYEKSARQPPDHLMTDIWTAYTQLQETALTNAEQLLMIDSYVDAVGLAPDQPLTNDLLLWIANGTDHLDDIDHVTHLNSVRRWLPNPQWRQPTPENLWMLGYPNALTLTDT